MHRCNDFDHGIEVFQCNSHQLIDEIVNNADEKMYNEKRIINLLNGTLIISKRGKVIFKDRHDKKDGSTNILKFNYDEKADCPKWKKFINRVLPNKQEQEALMQYINGNSLKKSS